MQSLLLHPPHVDPAIVFVVVKYWILFYVFQYSAFRLFTEADWLEKFCDNGRDAWLYQMSSPP